MLALRYDEPGSEAGACSEEDPESAPPPAERGAEEGRKHYHGKARVEGESGQKGLEDSRHTRGHSIGDEADEKHCSSRRKPLAPRIEDGG